MSNWTHVAGIVRVDCWRGLEDSPNFDEIFGKEVHYKSGDDVWNDFEEHPDDYLPYGSEGSLTKSVWINPNESYADAYTVSIFGDLRDHDDPDAIITWFENICNRIEEWWIVRDATVVVRNEELGYRTWFFEYIDEED